MTESSSLTMEIYLIWIARKVLSKNLKRKLWAVKARHMYELLQDLRNFELTQSCFGFGESHHLVLQDDYKGQEEILAYLQKKGHQAIQIAQIEPSIEDCFMALEHE